MTTQKGPRAGQDGPQGHQFPQAAPLVPWIGGKRRLAKHIIPVFPDHTCYVEPFCGAAALFFLKQPAKVEVLNDINSELVNLYRVVQNHLDEFVRQFRWALASRELFAWAVATPPVTLTDVQRAARFYYLMKCGFGGKVDGPTFGTATTSPPRLDLTRIGEDLSAVHLRLNQVTIEQLPWAQCVERYDRPHTLFYLDPPYWGTTGYGVEFDLAEYDRLAQLLASMKGKAVVSVNDIPEMRQAFKGLAMKRLEITYSVGTAGSGRKPTGELLIRNF